MDKQVKACPNCNNSGSYQIMPDGQPEQCQFCYEIPNSVFNVINALQADNERLRKLLRHLYGPASFSISPELATEVKQALKEQS